MEQINGYPIVATHNTPKARGTRAGRVIMADRGEGSHQRFVTAWQGRDGDAWDSSWCHGHYFDSRPAADADFLARSGRGH